MARFPELFSGRLGCAKGISVKLDVDPNVRPVRQPQRPVAFHLREAVGRELDRQVEQGILEPVYSSSGPTPWVSNLVVVPKDKAAHANWTNKRQEYTLEIRLTCDSKALNKAIRRTRFPGKTVEDLITQVNGATVFSKIDLIKAFHQFALDAESRNYTTITTHRGLYRYKRLHMGISCASEVFTEGLRNILLGCEGQLNMTDDILVYGKDQEEHDRNLMRVLRRLQDAGLTAHPGKCEFFKSELTFFGLRFSKEGIALS